MTYPLSLIPERFAPSTNLTAGIAPTVFRGKNCRIKGFDGKPKIVNYPGNLNLGEDYNIASETLTGTLSWTAGEKTVSGSGTSFLTQLHRGQMLLADTEVLVVQKIISDTVFLTDRAVTASASGVTARYMPGTLAEIDGKRAVLRRGSVLKQRRGDILFNGAGNLFLDGSDTGFTATRRPQRLRRNADGSYTLMPFGFDTVPPVPVVDGTTGGAKAMLAGNYSFMFAWYNSDLRSFSNPSDAVKKDSSTTNDIAISVGGRFKITFTNTFAVKSFTDGNVTTGTGNIAIASHGRATGDAVKVRNFGGALPVASPVLIDAVETYYVIVVDANNIKLARTKALALAGTAITYSSASGGGTHKIYHLPAQADGIVIYQSQSGGTVAAVNDSYFANGAWLEAAKMLISDLDSSDFYYHEAVDGELGRTATGDNDAPPDCEFMAEFASAVFFVSCLGDTSLANKDGTSPGKFVLSQKKSNTEAAPFRWNISVGDEITGVAPGLGRLFCLTDKGLPFISRTGRPEIAQFVPTIVDDPFTPTPFWTKGGISPHNVTTVQGDVFVWSGKKLLMSPRNADQYANPFELSKAVEDLTDNWADGFVFLKNDPENQHLLAVSSATKKNDAGYWISEILPLDLANNTFQPVIELSSNTRDMIVCAADVVNNRLEFLCGGRVSGGAYTVSTFRYSEFANENIDWYFAVQPSDLGEETLAKQIRALIVTARLSQGGEIQIHAADWSGNFSIDDLENGTNAVATFSVPASTGIARQLKLKRKVKNMLFWTLRFSGSWLKGQEFDRVEETVALVETHGHSQ